MRLAQASRDGLEARALRGAPKRNENRGVWREVLLWLAPGGGVPFFRLACCKSARCGRKKGPIGIWRRTQVAKGEVCKTSIHRFESGRRLFFPELHLQERALWGGTLD